MEKAEGGEEHFSPSSVSPEGQKRAEQGEGHFDDPDMEACFKAFDKDE